MYFRSPVGNENISILFIRKLINTVVIRLIDFVIDSSEELDPQGELFQECSQGKERPSEGKQEGRKRQGKKRVGVVEILFVELLLSTHIHLLFRFVFILQAINVGCFKYPLPAQV